MEDKREPISLAIRSVVFPFITFIPAYFVLLWIHSFGLAGIGLLPFAFLGIILLAVGFGLGVYNGVAAIQHIGKHIHSQTPIRGSKILTLAFLGIIFGMAELAYLAHILMR